MSQSFQDVVDELTQDHPRTVPHSDGTVTGREPGLLVLLERAIASDTGRGSASGGGSTPSAPIDPGALVLWDTIQKVVGEWWPGAGDPGQKDTPLPRRLRSWAREVPLEKRGYLLEMCLHWRGEIRNLLEPPKQVPLRGWACLQCGEEWAWVPRGGEIVRVYALLTHLEETPVRTECRNCGHLIFGGELLDLKAGHA